MRVWRTDIQNCPLNKRVTVIRGQCLEGDSKIFYESDIMMWACYATNEEAECLYT